MNDTVLPAGQCVLHPANLDQQNAAAEALLRLASEGCAANAGPLDALSCSLNRLMRAYTLAAAQAGAAPDPATAAAATLFAGMAGEMTTLLPRSGRLGVLRELGPEMMRRADVGLSALVSLPGRAH